MSQQPPMHAQARLGQPFRTELKVRQFAFVADEPPDHGGTDSGPRPMELLLSALCACTAITLKMYNQRKGYDVGEITVNADLHVEEASEETGGKPRQVVTLNLAFEKPPAPEVAERLLQISKMCPVHKALSGGVAIHSRLV